MNFESEYNYGFNDGINGVLTFEKGINSKTIKSISKLKNEPKWVLDIRMKAYEKFLKLKNPKWGPDLKKINFNNICFYIKPSEKDATSWDEVPSNIKNTFDKIGVIDAEKKYLSGIATQYDSEIVYHNMEEELKQEGVIFLSIDEAIQKHPQIFKEYFQKLIPDSDNRYAALNTAVFSGGSFIYVPDNIILNKPLHSYFRINSENMGQFERTLIIVGENASLNYIEGCTAPIYSKDSIHAGVVEIFVKKNGHCRYTSIQNWSNNVYNLVTKRAICEEGAMMEWIDGNLGSKTNMKYPAVILKGDNSKATTISVALASNNQIQDTGAKMIHLGKNTYSNIISKSISKNGGASIYRGFVRHGERAINAKTNIECDTLIMDEYSSSSTFPTNVIQNGTSTIQHEAKISRISEDQLYYLMSRGVSKEDANNMIILGFVDVFAKELPMEYAVELNQILKSQLKGSIG